ncbi:DUF2795 domain-containing protein [Paraburkholderia sp. Se-20369]|nr:DUF2795 domain-containing protein [Paraburkholderia sp. Se-20369]TCW85279.1 hypothetical protein C5O80_08680 [Burkholderia sp. SRS-46]
MTASPLAGREPGHVLAQQDRSDDAHRAARGKPPSPIDIQKALKGMHYPAAKADVLRCAERSHADRDVIDLLMRIPDREYGTPASVSKELGRLKS